jgi:hypothetical protein
MRCRRVPIKADCFRPAVRRMSRSARTTRAFSNCLLIVVRHHLPAYIAGKEGENALLRSELVSALGQVRSIVADAGLDTLLQHMTRERDGLVGALGPIMTSAVDLIKKYQLLSESEKKVVSILGLDPLFDINWWTRVVSGGPRPDAATKDANTSNSSPISLLRRVSSARDATARIVELLNEGRGDARPKVSIDHGTTEIIHAPPDGRLTLIIPEGPGERSSAIRVTEAIESVTQLYEGFARLRSETVETLTITNCDSGSNKVFDFEGLAGVMSEVRLTLVDLWDRILLHKEKRADAQIDLTIKSLRAFEELERAKQDNTVSPEQAHLVERCLYNGASKFLSAGVVTSDIVDRPAGNPLALAKPESKLLLASPATSTHSAAENDSKAAKTTRRQKPRKRRVSKDKSDREIEPEIERGEFDG